MNTQVFMAKLKELKQKMAELENLEQQESGGEVDVEEAPVEGLEEKVDQLEAAPESGEGEDKGGELDDDELLSMFGKVKKAPRPGMKVAVAVKPAVKAFPARKAK